MEKLDAGLAFHCHHEELFEYTYDYEGRVQYIRGCKPKSEQAKRLRLFKLIPKDRLPGQESKEYSTFTETEAIFLKARRTHINEPKDVAQKIRNNYSDIRTTFFMARNKYIRVYHKELTELHRELCPNCPWDGRTIFPKG